MNRIVEAAILHRGGVRTGLSHREIIDAIYASNGGYPIGRYQEGFITSENKFVNRFTAATIARLAGQVQFGIANPKEGLHSSDLC